MRMEVTEEDGNVRRYRRKTKEDEENRAKTEKAAESRKRIE